VGCTGNWDGDERNAFIILLGKPLGMWSLSVPMRIWRDHINMILNHTSVLSFDLI
jgi:hypothetical protein